MYVMQVNYEKVNITVVATKNVTVVIIKNLKESLIKAK